MQRIIVLAIAITFLALVVLQADIVSPLSPARDYAPVTGVFVPGLPLPPHAVCYYEDWQLDTDLSCGVYSATSGDDVYLTYNVQRREIVSCSFVLIGTANEINAGELLTTWGIPASYTYLGYGVYLWYPSGDGVTRFAFLVTHGTRESTPYSQVAFVGAQSDATLPTHVWKGWAKWQN